MRASVVPRWLRGLLAAFAVLLGLCANAATASGRPAGAPAEAGTAADAAATFYRWYLRQLVENKDPLHHDAATLKTHVTRALIAEIERKLNSPNGMDADYFIQSQDYLDEWVDSVSASASSRSPAAGLVTVSLGPAGAKSYRLSVKLVRESGKWKIRSVARIADKIA